MDFEIFNKSFLKHSSVPFIYPEIAVRHKSVTANSECCFFTQVCYSIKKKTRWFQLTKLLYKIYFFGSHAQIFIQINLRKPKLYITNFALNEKKIIITFKNCGIQLHVLK